MSERKKLLGLTDDPHAFAEVLASSLWFDTDFLLSLPTLQARPDLFDALRAKLPAYRRTLTDTWAPRVIWSQTRVTHAAFVQKANEVAQSLEPGFPTLELTLDVVWTAYCASKRGYDGRVNERGWVLEVFEQDIGPAEVIHEEDWLATAHGVVTPGTRLELGLYDRGEVVLCWWQRFSG